MEQFWENKKKELAKEWGVPISILDEIEKSPISQDSLSEEKKEKLANIILNFGKEWDSLKKALSGRSRRRFERGFIKLI